MKKSALDISEFGTSYPSRSIIKRVSFFISFTCIISCHCVLGAYIEAILIRYMRAYLLYKFHRNAGAWVFSKSFAVNGLISYPLLYLVLSVYFLP